MWFSKNKTKPSKLSILFPTLEEIEETRYDIGFLMIYIYWDKGSGDWCVSRKEEQRREHDEPEKHCPHHSLKYKAPERIK